jgi:hypothetical protein
MLFEYSDILVAICVGVMPPEKDAPGKVIKALFKRFQFASGW